MERCLIEELIEYVPEICREDIDRCHLQSNLDSPLFLNTVGSWHFRPGTKTRIDNLYITGDYCQSEADLTTMESTVISGLHTASHILEDQKLPADVGFIPLETYSRKRLLLIKYLALLPILLLSRLCRWGVLPCGAPK